MNYSKKYLHADMCGACRANMPFACVFVHKVCFFFCSVLEIVFLDECLFLKIARLYHSKTGTTQNSRIPCKIFKAFSNCCLFFVQTSLL